MRMIRNLWRNLVRRDRVERDLSDELRATLDLLVREKVSAGLTPAEARRAARLELGAVEAIKDNVRDVRAGAFLDMLIQDLRYGTRLLRRNPLFTLTATLSLAIGIGATTSIFTVANGLLLRSAVGVADPDRLVDIARIKRGDPGVEPISYPDLLDLRRRATTVQGIYAYQLELEPISLSVEDRAERVFANVVTTNFFQVLGVPAAAGRTFGVDDSDLPGTSPIAVLSHRYWTRRFEANPVVVGQSVRLNGRPFTIVGVAREGFRGMSVLAPDLWIPAGMVDVARAGSQMSRLTIRENGWLMAGARLGRGTSRDQASAEFAAIGSALAREFPVDIRYLPPGMAVPTFDWRAVSSSPVPAGLRGAAAAFLAVLMAVVSIVLVIASANVAGILLTRATVRRREIAVRTALGADRARVIRQLLTETLVLFALGSGAGLLLARVLTSLIVQLLPSFPLPVNLSLPLDGRVIAFSLALGLIAAVLSGLAPALQASKTDVVAALKDDAQAPVGRLRLRNAFVIAQVAFSTLLVMITAVLVHGLDHVTSIDRGFDARGVDIAVVDLSMAGYTSITGPPFVRDVLGRVRALPGVATATVANRAPGPGTVSLGGVTVPGATPPNGAPFFYPNWTLVEPGYFSTLRIPLVAGRDFGVDDREGREPVAIIGEAATRRLWPGEDAVGRFVLVNPAAPGATAIPHRIVGVARDILSTASARVRRAAGETPFALYVPLQQRFVPQVSILVRRTGRSVAGDLHMLVTSMDRNLPVLNAQTLESQLNGSAQTQLRISAAVAGSAGIVGLLLAGIGIYGVTAYTVTRRTREIGIRLSLGASRVEIVGLVLGQGMRLVAFGSAVGRLTGTAAGVLLSRRLNIPGPDVLLVVGVTTLFATIGLVACYVPTRRATSICSMEALRGE
jgi:putative ABC transport system permease protein